MLGSKGILPEEAVALLDRYGIKTILGTPTAAPPAWIVRTNPELQPIDREGRRRFFGGRLSLRIPKRYFMRPQKTFSYFHKFSAFCGKHKSKTTIF